MLLVTGGAGFIGSNVVAALNDAGCADVTVCDGLGHDGKWRNLAKRQLADIVPPAELPDWLKGEVIRGSYQYFTQSEVDRLQRAGYNGGFTALEGAVEAYVKGSSIAPIVFADAQQQTRTNVRF
jgi:nucleoside-diphosphate-sugar epimerase